MSKYTSSIVSLFTLLLRVFPGNKTVQLTDFTEQMKKQYASLLEIIERLQKDYLELSNQIHAMNRELLEVNRQLNGALTLQCNERNCVSRN